MQTDYYTNISSWLSSLTKDNQVPESLLRLCQDNTTRRKPAQGEGSDGQHIGTNSLVVHAFLQSFKCPFCEFGEP